MASARASERKRRGRGSKGVGGERDREGDRQKARERQIERQREDGPTAGDATVIMARSRPFTSW
jgi:hypothetical protein